LASAIYRRPVTRHPVRANISNDSSTPETHEFVLLLENADAAEMRRIEGRETGLIFFTGHPPEKTIQGLQKRTEQLVQPLKAGKS